MIVFSSENSSVSNISQRDSKQIAKIIQRYILSLTDHDCDFIKVPELDDNTMVFRKFASLFFVCVVDEYESQFAIIDLIRIVVDLLDEIFKNCREIDIKYNPEKVSFTQFKINLILTSTDQLASGLDYLQWSGPQHP